MIFQCQIYEILLWYVRYCKGSSKYSETKFAQADTQHIVRLEHRIISDLQSLKYSKRENWRSHLN